MTEKEIRDSTDKQINTFTDYLINNPTILVDPRIKPYIYFDERAPGFTSML